MRKWKKSAHDSSIYICPAHVVAFEQCVSGVNVTVYTTAGEFRIAASIEEFATWYCSAYGLV